MADLIATNASGEREGEAMAIARQWLPKIKSKAQVKRKKFKIGIHVKTDRKVKLQALNPLDFAMSIERLAIAEATADFSKVFGPILAPVESNYRPRRGRRSNADRESCPIIDLDSI